MTAAMELVSATKVIQNLEDGYGSPSALKTLSVSLLKKASKEVCQYVGKTDRGFRLLEDLLGGIQNLLRHNGSLFQCLADLGLIELIADTLQAVYQRLRTDGTAEGLQAAVEMLLESANVLGDLGPSAKSQSCQGLCCYLLDLLQVEQLDFQLKMEVVKSTNMLLDQCPTATKEAMMKMEAFQKKIKEIVCLIREIGDYEFQVGLVECLIRLFPRKSRQLYASQFIRDTAMLEGFLSIKDREFETDCRKFLNDLNSEIDSENVYSIPCLAAYVGNKQLRKPSDSGYDQFWVDFNIGSQRMTLFCEQDSLLSQGTQMDEQLWETVAIYRTDILQCSCSEIQNTILLEIALKQRVCELYPSQHQDVTDNTVRVEFELHRESQIAEAVGKTFSFSEIRNKVSTVVNPIHISVKEIQEMDSQLQQESEEVELPYQQTNMQPPASQENSARRRKVSVPSIPMRTPLSTPVLPAEQMKTMTAAHVLPDENRKSKDKKVSSASTPLKISTRENITVTEQQRTSKQAPQDAETHLGGKKKKNHAEKENYKKQKDFVAPKTPLPGGKMSKPKVKTPVVTVTPPAVSKKRKKAKQQVLKTDATEKHNDELPQNNDSDLERIPDSIPAAEIDLHNNMALKEVDKSKNTTMDSGINMDVSTTSVGNISRELKEENNVSLPTIQENEPTECKEQNIDENAETKQKEFTRNRDRTRKEDETNNRSKALNDCNKGRTKHETKNDKDKSNSDNESHKKDTKVSGSSLKKGENLEDFESQAGKTDNKDKSKNNAKKDIRKQEIVGIGNKQSHFAEVQEDDEDKFDFDSQEDKIPESLEPSIEPNIKPKDDNLEKAEKTKLDKPSEKSVKEKTKIDKPLENPQKENSITGRYSKILSTKGSKEALRESIEQTAKYIEEEAEARSRRNSGSLTPSKATDVRKNKSKSFTDDEPSLKELFDLEKNSKEKHTGKTKLTTKEKTSKKSKKNKDESLKCGDNSNTHKSKKGKATDKAQQEEQMPSRRSLRKRGTNKSYKEIEESDISFVEESQKVDVDSAESDKKDDVICEKEFIATKLVTTNEEDQSDDMEENEDSFVNDSFHEQVNVANSEASSDISEDYRFNNSQASQDLSQNAEMATKVCSSAGNKNEQIDVEETWSKVVNLDSKNQTERKQTKNKKTKETKKANKHENLPNSDNMVMSENEDSNAAHKKNIQKKKDNKPEYRKKDSDTKSSHEEDHSFEILEENKSIEQYKKGKQRNVKQGKKDKSKSVTHAQKNERVKFEEGLDGGHFKHSQVNSVSKKKGKGFVFQMSYCRSETNYKYNNPISAMYKSKFSKGYDPFDFGTCENEVVMSEGDSQNFEDKNSSSEPAFKPRKFFKHSRKDSDQTLDESNAKNRKCNKNKSVDDDSDTKEKSIMSHDLNDSLVMSLTSPSAHKSRSKTKQDKHTNKGRSKMHSLEEIDMETGKSLNLIENSPMDDKINKTHSHAKSKHSSREVKGKKNKKNNAQEKVDSAADSESSLACSPDSPKVEKKKTNRRTKDDKQTQKKSIKSDQTSDSVVESDGSLIVSPDLPNTRAHTKRKQDKNDSKLNRENSIQYEENSRSSRKSDKHSGGSNSKSHRSKLGRKDYDSPIEINSDDNSESDHNKSRSKRLMKQDPVTKKWYRQSDMCDSKDSEQRSHKHRRDTKKTHQTGDSPDFDEINTTESFVMEHDVVSEEENTSSQLVQETSKLTDERCHRHRKEKEKQKKEETSIIHNTEDNTELDLENDDDNADQEEENCFSRIVKDIIGSREGKKKDVKNEKKMSRKRKVLAEKSIEEDSRNISEPRFKEFDSEIVDCVVQDDGIQTPCVSASLASTPKFGSTSRKRYNPLDISVIKTPVSLTKSVTFDDDVGDNDDSDKENIPPETTNERKSHRSRRRKKSVQYKDLSDEDIDQDERLSLSSGRRSISSMLDSSNNMSTRSEKSWILERKKTLKPKPKTYKSRNKDGTHYNNSQTESSDEEEDNKSTASKSLSGRTGTLSLDGPTPSLSSLYREARGQIEDENMILTPVTPLKLTSSQHKSEDDIEIYQTQENCLVSLNMDKKHPAVEEMDVGEIGNICLSALGVKTPQKYPQDEGKDYKHKKSKKKLEKNIQSFLGDSGFASGPSSEVRPSRSTLKRKYPDLVECESGSSDEEQDDDEAEKSTLVPKKLFKFDHSSILQTVKEELSDTASTCSDTMETGEQMDYSMQSGGGLSSFLAAFAADAKKHFNLKKQKFETLTKTALKSTQKQFTTAWMEQQQYQSGVTDDFQARMMIELAQLESDITLMKENEAKAQEFFKGQLEALHNNFQSQKKRLDNFKKLYSSYDDRAKKVELYNTATHKTMMDQLRKEMKHLQKKLIEETQKQELMNVRRGLQNLF